MLTIFTGGKREKGGKNEKRKKRRTGLGETVLDDPEKGICKLVPRRTGADASLIGRWQRGRFSLNDPEKSHWRFPTRKMKLKRTDVHAPRGTTFIREGATMS